MLSGSGADAFCVSAPVLSAAENAARVHFSEHVTGKACGQVRIFLRKRILAVKITLMGGMYLWTHVRFGSKADMCSAPTHVRFTPRKRTLMASCLMSGLRQ
jgi:hypothetical protein